MLRIVQPVLLVAFLTAAIPARSQTVPLMPLFPRFCVIALIEDYGTENPSIIVRSACEETVDWVVCLRDGDMSTSNIYEGTLEPAEEAYIDITVISQGNGDKLNISGFANYQGQELPIPEC
jgi:hypothetical protein